MTSFESNRFHSSVLPFFKIQVSLISRATRRSEPYNREKEKDVSFEGRKRHDALSRDLGSIYTQNVEQVSTWDDQDAARPVRSSEQRAQANLKPEAPLSALLPTNNKIERFLREASTIEYRGVLSTMTIDKNSFLRSSISQNGDHCFRLWKMAEIYLKRVLSIFL
uniref:Uncharacterized protein n=1 Tax=Vespula pensylvanica TaxID=30213 RepID=A0A834UD97_VESPE|nr:hypothetical protein H0235_005229 [Vespula pensylvanica]